MKKVRLLIFASVEKVYRPSGFVVGLRAGKIVPFHVTTQRLARQVARELQLKITHQDRWP